MKVNATVNVYLKTKDWAGKVTLGPAIPLSVWLEESTQTRWANGTETFYAAGYFFTTTDLPYENYSVEVNGTMFDIFTKDRLTSQKGFHHSEVFFK